MTSAIAPLVLPTHTCFDDALDYLVHRIRADPSLFSADQLYLVHGIALAPEGQHAGEPFAHAWVEEHDKVWQAGILADDGVRIYYAMDRAEFYEKWRIQKSTRYTAKEADEENVRSNHYGPWLEEYRELCGRERTIYA